MVCDFFFYLQFGYKVDKVQLAFLQLLSSQAAQNITYLCRNSVAYLDGARNSYNRALKLMANNDLEITAEGYPTFVYKAIRDGCQVTLLNVQIM